MKTIREDVSVHELVKRFPEALHIMVDLGFRDIQRPGMLNTVGRFMTLKKGCKLKGIDYEEAKAALAKVGIILQEED